MAMRDFGALRARQHRQSPQHIHAFVASLALVADLGTPWAGTHQPSGSELSRFSCEEFCQKSVETKGDGWKGTPYPEGPRRHLKCFPVKIDLPLPRGNCTPRGRTATQRSKRGSDKVLGGVLGKGSQNGSEKGACYGFDSKKEFWEGFSGGVLRRGFPEGA